MRLSERVSMLERSHRANDMVLIVSWVNPEGTAREIEKLTGDGREWVRQEGESERAFTDRAIAEVRRTGTPLCVLFVAGTSGPSGR